MDRALAVDALRALRVEARGYAVATQTIPAAVTPKNRLLIARAAASRPVFCIDRRARQNR
jgi:hypothetical protein